MAVKTREDPVSWTQVLVYQDGRQTSGRVSAPDASIRTGFLNWNTLVNLPDFVVLEWTGSHTKSTIALWITIKVDDVST